MALISLAIVMLIGLHLKMRDAALKAIVSV